ncbi:MAG: tail fiber domain-containing protein, partial [Verrucomicrobiota bacterium]
GTNAFAGVVLATNANNVIAGSFTGSGAGLTQLNGSVLTAGSVTADKLAAGQVVKSVNGLHDNVTLTAGANIVLTPNGNSLQISAASAAAPWSLTGNSGTSPTNGNFLGTTDNQPLELRVNGMRALSLVPTDGFADPYNYWYGVCNLTGGSSGNWIAPGVIGSVIAGGGSLSHSFQYSFISSDTNAVSASFSFLGGGAGNTIQTNAGFAFLGGGVGNAVGAQCAMVPGGDRNYAGGVNSFAAGHRARAIYSGDFVWADSQDADFNATDHDQFSVRASGGARFVTGGAGLAVDGPVIANALGTTDNQPLELRVNGMRALSLVPTDGFADPYNYWYGVCNLTGGSSGNWIAPGVIGSVIAGGGSLSHSFQYSFISSDTNAVSASFSFLGGGAGNTIQTNAGFAFLGGGVGNAVGAQCAMVPGGDRNYAGGVNSFAAGHRARAIYSGDFVWADSQDADFNATDHDQFSVRASGGVRLVTAGAGMTIDGLPVLAGTVTDARLSANVARLNASQTFIGTNCFNGRVGIGVSNPGVALDVSGAMRAGIIYDADNQNYYVDPASTSLLNDVRVSICYDRADTSYYLQPHSVSMLNTMNASTVYAGVVYDKANPGYYLIPSGASLCSDLRANIFYDRADTSYYLQPHSSTVLNLVRAGKMDVCNPSGTTTITLNGTNGTVTALTLTQTSDRNAKENFRSVSAGEILAKVAALPISEWNYKQDTSATHIGPMAQDFYAAFNVGPDDKHITTVDESGVALAAIQGLNHKLEEQAREKDSEINALKSRLEKLEQIISTLTGGAK